jgi:hypothetical protein
VISFFPSPLVGEGGENERSEVETGEGLRSVDREKDPSPGSPPLCFGDPPLSLRFSYFISIRCPTRKCEIYTRLHIGSKIEIDPESGGRPPPRGSDIDLFGYGKSIINLDAKVAHRALDLGVAKQELYGS